MQVKELKSEGLNYELEVTVTAQDIDKEVNSKLQEYAKTVKLPGFRPGKVPMDILKKRYGRSVMGEVLEKAVNDSTAKVIEDKGLRPALQPKIEVKKFDEGKDLTYTMALEVLPDFDVMDVKKLNFERQTVKPATKDVEEALERIAKQNRESEPVKPARASKKGDVVLIDFQGRTKKDGKEHPGMHSHDHALELGSGQFVGTFEDQLIGKKAGEKATVEVTFPDPYQSADLAGQDAIFEVEIKEIREFKSVKVDEDFAKKHGFGDEKALRDAIEHQLQAEYDKVSRMKLKRSLLDALDDGHDFPIPNGMLDLEFSNIKQQIIMERQGELNEDGEIKLEKTEEDELHAIAERRVRLGMILSEIGLANNIQVADQELQHAVITEAQKFPGQEAQIFEYYKSNPQALDALRAPVFEDKVVDFVIELASITDKEVSLDELTAEDDEDESYLEQKKKNKSASKSTSGEKKKAPAKSAAKKSTTKTPAAESKKSTKSSKKAD